MQRCRRGRTSRVHLPQPVLSVNDTIEEEHVVLTATNTAADGMLVPQNLGIGWVIEVFACIQREVVLRHRSSIYARDAQFASEFGSCASQDVSHPSVTEQKLTECKSLSTVVVPEMKRTNNELLINVHVLVCRETKKLELVVSPVRTRSVGPQRDHWFQVSNGDKNWHLGYVQHELLEVKRHGTHYAARRPLCCPILPSDEATLSSTLAMLSYANRYGLPKLQDPQSHCGFFVWRWFFN